MSTEGQDQLEPLASEAFREVIGHFASGVTVITTSVDGKPYGTTASAVSSLSLEPPMMLVCMNQESSTGRAIAQAGSFAVNILGEGQDQLARRFAGKGDDKFEGVDIRVGDHGLPLIADTLAQLACRVSQQVVAGTHVIFIAEVHEATAHPGAPLAYYRGRFGRFSFDETPA